MNIQKSFEKKDHATGTLYLVATPIGNLQDMTYRAVSTLKEVQWIAAEDTRQTSKLLHYFDIHTRQISYHEHNKQTSGAEIIRKLVGGESVALVSDAGLPAISDPGYELVRSAIEHQVSIVPIPGANAALSALIVSGLPTASFLFVGFLPRDKKKLAAALERLKPVRDTIVCYEAPHRIVKTLQKISEQLGDRQVALARELTKKYEEIVRGSVGECLHLLKEHPPQGEYCLVIEGAQEEQAVEASDNWWSELSIAEHVQRYTDADGDRKEAMKRAAADRGISKREVYDQLVKAKNIPEH